MPRKKTRWRVNQDRPVHAAAKWLSGQEFPEWDLPCHEYYMMLGFGPLQIQNGAARWKHHLRCSPKLTTKEFKEWRGVWEHRHQRFVIWRDTQRKTAVREGMVVNPFGRRAWGLRDGEVERFLLLSTAFDALKTAVVTAKVRPQEVGFGFLWVRYQRERAAILDVQTEIPWEDR